MQESKQQNSSSAKIGGAILCAGYGSRMAPITDVVPKPLLPFLNVPTVAYPLAQLMEAGIKRVALNTHHLADAIPPVVEKLADSFGMKALFVKEEKILGSGGGIKGVVNALGDECEHIIIMNGDTVLQIDLSEHLQRHLDSKADVTLVVRPKVDTQPGRVFLDGDGAISRIRDYKNSSYRESHIEHDFLGIHIIKREIMDTVPLEYCDIIDVLYGRLVEEGKAIRASLHNGYFVALDTPELLMDSSIDAMSDPSLFADAPFPKPLRKGLYVYRPGTIANAAQVTPPVFIGANVTIGAGAKIGPNVVLDGAEVLPGTEIRNSILYGVGKVEGIWEECVSIAGKTVTLKSRST